MPFSKGVTVVGWGVFRSAPWHLAGIYDGKEEAAAKWLQMGDDYIVRRGEGQEGTDNFVVTEEGPHNA